MMKVPGKLLGIFFICEPDISSNENNLLKIINYLLTNNKSRCILVATQPGGTFMTNFFDNHADALTKAATIITKLMEVAYDIGAVGLVVGLVLFLADPVVPLPLVSGTFAPGEELTIHGFSIVCGDADGIIRPAFIICLLTGAILLALMGWVFRNTWLILRTTQGKTKFSKGKTPFQKDNVRMLREIGFFFMGMSVVRFVMSAAAVMAIGLDKAEISANAGDFIIGLLMLCLAQCFAQGEKMQQDVDGLV